MDLGRSLFYHHACCLVHHPARMAPIGAPWPLSQLIDSASAPVQVVVADANYGIMLLLSDEPVTLRQYLSPSYWDADARSKAELNTREARIIGYLFGSTLTSFADAVVSSSLVRLSGVSGNRLTINSARNLRPRDLESGNFIFIGGPRSNPWVSTFQDKLNFQEGMSPDNLRMDCFENLHPNTGEQKMYCAASASGSPTTVFYSTISLLPLPDGHGT